MRELLNLLAEDKDLVPYRKSLRKIAGSVTSTILLQQMIYWGKSKNWEPFFKFKSPCNHELYQEGDSWTEELGFSIAEFDNALKKIGTKVTKGQSKTALLLEDKPQHIVLYWTDSSRVTWYQVNVNLLGKLTKSIYLEDEQSEDSRKTNKVDLPITETTTETTTERESPSPDYLSDLVNQQGKTSEATAPNPEDQYWIFRDEFLKEAQKLSIPNEFEKDAIIVLVGSQEADLNKWKKAVQQTGVNYKGSAKIARAIEVYQYGNGDYEEWRKKKYPDSKDNGNAGAPQLTPEQREVWQKLRQEEAER